MNYFLVCLTDGFTVVSDVSFLQFRAMNKHFRAILETLNGVRSRTSTQEKKNTITTGSANSNGFYV